METVENEHRRNSVSTRFRKLSTAIVWFSLVLLSIGSAAAQPGDQRTPEQIKKDLDARMEQANEYLAQDPRYGPYYGTRADVYSELSWRTHDPNERAVYSQRALDDYNMAIMIEPGSWDAFANRADFRMRTDYLGNFDAMIDDYKQAIRLAKEFRKKQTVASPNESPVPNYYRSLSAAFLNRAEAFVRNPETVPATPGQLKENSPWDDFDTALSYARKYVQKPQDLWEVVNVLLRKGEAAYYLGEYDIAIDAYQRDEKYLGPEYRLLCEDQNPDSYCSSQKRDLTVTFTLKRARVYVNLREPEKALAELEVYFAKAYHFDCAQPFLLRAKANRLLGRIDLALKDEEIGKKKSTSGSSGCSGE